MLILKVYLMASIQRPFTIHSLVIFLVIWSSQISPLLKKVYSQLSIDRHLYKTDT